MNNDAGVGQAGFANLYGLSNDRRKEAVAELSRQIRSLELRTIRMVVVDQHGAPRAKFLSPDAAIAALENGLDFSGAIYSLDTGNQVFVPAFSDGGGFGISEFTGFPDVVLLPDPETFRVLPWASKTGWILCDVYFSNGKPMPLDGRNLMRQALAKLEGMGLSYLAGIEIEFYIAKIDRDIIPFSHAGSTPPAPPVSVFELGYQYLSEVRLDSVSETLEAIRDGLYGVGLLPRSMEDEWGPGQMEFSFSPISGLAAADAVILFRSAVKQLCQRRGLLASFMCRPGLENFFSSGWHLHESLLDQNGENVFASPDRQLSETAEFAVSGLLNHAEAMCVFSTPTVNGYKRYRPYSFAPDRICWAVENRGALVRVQGGAGDSGTHLENRIGEPAANPYLYMAANIEAMIDGIVKRSTPPPAVGADPYASSAKMLPIALKDAVDLLDKDEFYRSVFGHTFVEYITMMKRAEVSRYDSWLSENPSQDPTQVTDWEMREYFEFF